MRVRVLEDPDLSRLGPALEDLHAATGAPVTVHPAWFATWLRCYPDHQPLAVIVEGPEGLHAAAFLARRRGRGITRIHGVGHGQSDYQRFVARDPESAELLADGMAEALKGLRGPWELLVEQLPAGDPVVAAVARRLRWSALLPGEGAPRLRLEGRDLKAYVRRNDRQTERNGWSRIRREGLAPSLSAVRDPDAVAALLPELERVRRSRDVETRRWNMMEKRALRFWREAVLEMARLEKVELIVLRLDGEVAAYDVCLIDGDAYRVWDGRIDPRYSRFSPGRLIYLATLRRVLADPVRLEYDWMRGEEPYKVRTSSAVVPSEHLLAWSSAWVRGTLGSYRLGRSRLKQMKDRHPALIRAWSRLRSMRGPRRG